MKFTLLLTLFFFFTAAYAKQNSDKIYITKDQIEITEEGIYAHVPGSPKAFFGRSLSFDQKGMYIKLWRGPCYLHELWCHMCGGCGVLLCPMNCTCFD